MAIDDCKTSPTKGLGIGSTMLTTFNKWLANNDDDRLYHFGISKNETNIIKKFSQIKFVCTGGSASRIHKYAELFSKEFYVALSNNLSNTDRFNMYITGPVLWINHGIGVPSLSIMLIECIKLLYYAKAVDVKFIRLGTSGGVGVEPGTLVITSAAMNDHLQNKLVQYVNGQMVEHDALLDKDFNEKLYQTAKKLKIPAESGITLCADDFYEGQMRLDGFFCDFKAEDKMNFLKKLYDLGVRNIEMESTGFAAYTHRAKISAIVCVTLVNRIISDQVVLEKKIYEDFEMRPFRLVSSFISEQCGLKQKIIK